MLRGRSRVGWLRGLWGSGGSEAKRTHGIEVKRILWAMDIKYAITTFIAVVALLVSGSVAYFTNLRQLEELRVVPERLIPLFEDAKASELLMPLWLRFTFINSGNTSLAIVGASASAGHSAAKKVSPTEGCEHDAEFDTDLEPFVLKQSDVVVKKVTLMPNINFKDRTHKTDNSLSVDVTEAMKKTSEAMFCMRFDLAAPSNPLAYGEFVLGRYKFEQTGTGKMQETSVQIQYPTQPNIIWHSTRFIFN
jgi:hypothetical protein